MNISRPGRLILTTLSLTSFAVPSLAQEGTGIRANLSFDQRFDYSDNPDFQTTSAGSKTTSTTNIGFGLRSETRTESLRLNLGAAAVGASGSGATSEDDLELRNQNGRVSYNRRGANSSLSLGAEYSNFRIDDEVFGFFVDGAFDPDALIIDGGTREQTIYNLSFETGIEGPFGVSLRASLIDNDYENVADPDLVDETIESLDGVARFSINPAVTGRLLAGIRSEDSVDPAERDFERSYVGFGLEAENARGLTLRGNLTLDDTETRELGAVVEDDSGVGVSLSAEQEQPDGVLQLSFSSRIDEAGRRTTASIERSFDFPEGALSVSIGLADQEDSTMEITTRLTYERDLPAGARFQAGVVQQPTTDNGTAFLNTSVDLNYLQNINSISSWSAGFSYGAATEFGASDGDTRTSASLTYNRSLSEAWRMSAGVSTTHIDSEGATSRSRNTVFLSVGRDFSFGF